MHLVPGRGSLEEALCAVPSMIMSLGAQVLSPPGCQSSDVKPEVSPSADRASRNGKLRKHHSANKSRASKLRNQLRQRCFSLLAPNASSFVAFSLPRQHCCIPKPGKSHLLHPGHAPGDSSLLQLSGCLNSAARLGTWTGSF